MGSKMASRKVSTQPKQLGKGRKLMIKLIVRFVQTSLYFLNRHLPIHTNKIHNQTFCNYALLAARFVVTKNNNKKSREENRSTDFQTIGLHEISDAGDVPHSAGG